MAVGTPLQTSFCFSFMRRGKGGTNTTTVGTGKPAEDAEQQQQQQQQDGTTTTVVHPYESSIRTITTVSTVEGFWEVYNWLKRPSDLPTTTDYHFFRGGIKPTWEDPGNAKGGKWIVRLPKGLASRYWEEVILALIGGQLSPIDGEVCGAVLSVRYNEDILGVWNRTAANREIVERIRDAIKKCLQLPPHANMEYKPHTDSISDRSSFRNTQVWKPKSLMGEARSSSMGDALASSPPGPSAGGASSSGGGGGSSHHSSSHHHHGASSGPPRRSTWVSSGDGPSTLKRGQSTGGRWRNPN